MMYERDCFPPSSPRADDVSDYAHSTDLGIDSDCSHPLHYTMSHHVASSVPNPEIGMDSTVYFYTTPL